MPLVAAARAASVIQHSLRDPFADRPNVTDAEQLNVACCQSIEVTADDAVTQALLVQPAKQTEMGPNHRLDVVTAAESKVAAQKASSHIHGLTPEHMLYWVSQADVAQQLRSSQQQDAATVAVEFQVLADQQSGASTGDANCPMDVEASIAKQPSVANVCATDCSMKNAATVLLQTSVAETAACQQQKSRKAVKQKPARTSGSVRKAGHKQSYA